MFQLENLQNYFHQNKFVILDNNQKSYSFSVNNILNNIFKIKDEENRCLYYSGNNANEILLLIYLHLHYKIELIFGNKNNLDSSYMKTSYKNIYTRNSNNGNFSIFTSGTTGEPKKVILEIDELIKKIKITKSKNLNWLLTYNPKSYAGLQVILTAFLSNNTLYAPIEKNTVNNLLNILRNNYINAISATPTFWKIFLSTELKKTTKLDLITLGGEIIEEDLLSELISAFPKAKITQIYATTEFGKLFSVNDKKAGFPIEYLEKYNLKIIDDALHTKVKNNFLSTKDIVKIKKDRVFFVGRNSDFVKIAGNRVNLNSIENKIKKLPNVLDIKIKTKPSKIVDVLLTADVVLKNDNEGNRLEFKKLLRNSLNHYEVPRFISFVKKLKLNSNLKKSK